MIPRSGPRLPVLSPGHILAFGDPHRLQECFLTEVSSNGLQVRTNFALPVDEVIGMELETHLVLVDVRSCQLRHGKFWIGVERLHAVSIAGLDATLTFETDAAPEGDVRQIARLLALLESFLQEPSPNPSRRVMSQSRAAYGKLLTRAAQLASGTTSTSVDAEVSEPPAVETELPVAQVLEDFPQPVASILVASTPVASMTIVAEAEEVLLRMASASVDAPAKEAESTQRVEEPAYAVEEVDGQPDQLEPAIEVFAAGAGHAQATEAAHVPFFYSVPVDLALAHHSPHAAPPPDWIYHFVPSPKAPIVPDLNYTAKGLIEALHATA